MEKVSILVRVPALDNTYEFLVPGSMAVRDVQNLVARILASEFGVSNDPEGFLLLDTNDGKALRPECSLSQQGVADGARLVLL